MKLKTLFKYSYALLVAIGILLSASTALAQSTSFTYQGRLTDGGSAANGNYDLQFALWDNLSAGAQVGSTQTLNAVAVSNGVFTVTLDFGANAFNGASRFLEISARPAGSGSFVLLSPRQPITSTPYAVRSLHAVSADTVPVSGVPAGSGNYIQNTTSVQPGNFNLSGNATVGQTLSGNVVNAATQFNIGGSRVFTVSGGQTHPNSNVFAGVGAGQNNQPNQNIQGVLNSFFGAGAGQANTTGAENAFFGASAGLANVSGSDNAFFGGFAGRQNTTGALNTFLGSLAGAVNTTGSRNTFVGFGAGSSIDNDAGSLNTLLGAATGVVSGVINSTAIGYQALVTRSDSLVLGRADINVNVGIGTTAPTQKLHVKGQGLFTADTPTFDPGDGVGPAIRIGFDSNGDYGYINANNTGFAAKNLILQPNFSQGSVGIGTTAPDQRLSVIGNASKSAGGTSWTIFSDERLKNIKGPFTPGLKALLQLQPIRYQYKPDNALRLPDGGEEVGFSAQAVEQVLPEAVSRNQQGYLQLHSDPILWTMLNAIKEQQAQLAALRQVNSTLNARLRKLERSLRKKSAATRR